jgi:hypothetical protein
VEPIFMLPKNYSLFETSRKLVDRSTVGVGKGILFFLIYNLPQFLGSVIYLFE